MPTYHFHSGDIGHDLEDMEIELADLKAAKHEAARMLNEMLRGVWDRWEDSRVIVTNDEGLILFTMEVVPTAPPALSNPVRH